MDDLYHNRVRQRAGEHPADFVRRLGLGVGSVLAGDRTDLEGPVAPIIITAVGEQNVLARSVGPVPYRGQLLSPREGSWTFDCRDWQIIERVAAHPHAGHPCRNALCDVVLATIATDDNAMDLMTGWASDEEAAPGLAAMVITEVQRLRDLVTSLGGNPKLPVIPSDDELPGMWSGSDLIGGWAGIEWSAEEAKRHHG